MPDRPTAPGKSILTSKAVTQLLDRFPGSGGLLSTAAESVSRASTPTTAAPPITKLIVAVHGIGDQVRNETILATTVRFCDHFDYEGMVPLGAFHQLPRPAGTATPPADPTYIIRNPPCDGLTDNIGFAEAHWADLARAISDEKHTLQETKAWARSIVQRIRDGAGRNNPHGRDIDHRRIRLVLEEMIDAIAVLQSLLLLSAKAGLFEFDLKKILDAFLGDVQLVAEFARVRAEIVRRFHETIASAAGANANADIHVIAHSEGTVVAFLGLLEACTYPSAHKWIHRVRGFMTLGSPIDKHLILWPQLFAGFPGPDEQTKAEIRWFNYVDYGDPVGFELDTAREWLQQRRYDRVFRFDPADDFAFRRYPVPGAAHVGYWNDPELFDHFIRRVIAPPGVPTRREDAWLRKGPRTIWWVPLVSYGVAYVLPLALIHLAVFILCRAVSGYLAPGDAVPHPNFIATALGLGWLLAGTTIWLRMIRLARTRFWFLLGALIYAVGAGAFYALVSHPRHGVNELDWFEPLSARLGWPPGLGVLALSGALILAVLAVDQVRLLHRHVIAPFLEPARPGR